MPNNNYLFLFTITPVQSFLSQARKTQDLFAGSQILSALINAGMNAFDKRQVIFPAILDGESLKDMENASYPNRFLAKTNSASKDQGMHIETVVKEELKRIAEAIFKKNGINNFQDYYKQVDTFFSFFWLFEKIENNDYRSAFLNIERQLGAIKNLRSFKQNPEIGRKCSLTGEHNALFFKPNALNQLPAFVNSEENSKYFAERVERSNPKYISFLTSSYSLTSKDVDFGEGLSAIAYLKRFYYKNRPKDGFPSTARIAAFNVLKEIKEEQEYKDYIALFDQGENHGNKYDEQLLYAENIRLGYFEKQGLSGLISEHYAFFPYTNSRLFSKKSKKDILGKIQKEFDANIVEFEKEHKKITALIKRKEVNLSSYYALVLFDADNMGAWLNGETYLPENVLSNLEEYHNTISGLLSSYARNSKKYLDEGYRGKTVYAGGDDFMGFVNLTYLFDVLKDLRENFRKEVSEPLRDKFKIPIGKDLTFSAGVVVAHYKHPLSDVLLKVREAEYEAKNTKEKDALCFSVLKSSGERLQSVLKWNHSVGIEDLKIVIKCLEENFSTKFIHVLHNELDIYKKYDFSEQDEDGSKAEKIVSVEIKRLINRACLMTSSRDKETEILKLHNALMDLYGNCLLRTGKIYNFLDLLQIVDFLKRKAKI